MYLIIHALLIALLALPLGAVREPADGPECHAQLDDHTLTTRVDLLSGISVEGAWQVTEAMPEAGSIGTVMYATLDRMIESDALTGVQVTKLLPRPIQIRLKGDSKSAVVRRAAETWCVVVLRTQQRATPIAET